MKPAANLTEPVAIPVRGGELYGDLVLPGGASAIVVFAHGSGSSRHSPRNRFVAATLQGAGLGTLLLDLLTEREERAERVGGKLRFDVELLAERLTRAADWLEEKVQMPALRLGYFGASTGAAAALLAASAQPQRVGALVSRGGRPDLVPPESLRAVTTPCLFIVGGDDPEVLAMNRQAFAQLQHERRLDVIRGASHLFEEPGALDQVAQLAREWFARWLVEEEP
jgi:putative phosphoribosyl transferase